MKKYKPNFINNLFKKWTMMSTMRMWDDGAGIPDVAVQSRKIEPIIEESKP